MSIEPKQFAELSSSEQAAIVKLIKTDFPAAKALYNTYLSAAQSNIKPYKTNN
jgi:hypothetical protein